MILTLPAHPRNGPGKGSPLPSHAKHQASCYVPYLFLFGGIGGETSRSTMIMRCQTTKQRPFRSPTPHPCVPVSPRALRLIPLFCGGVKLSLRPQGRQAGRARNVSACRAPATMIGIRRPTHRSLNTLHGTVLVSQHTPSAARSPTCELQRSCHDCVPSGLIVTCSLQ